MVEDHAWEYLADRIGHAIVTMVAHGLKTKDRFDATLTEVTVGLSCSALSYRQLDGMEDHHAPPIKQEPAKETYETTEVDEEGDEEEEEDEGEDSGAEQESDPEPYKSDDTLEYQPPSRVRRLQIPVKYSLEDDEDVDDLLRNDSPGEEEDTDMGQPVNKSASGSPSQVSSNKVTKTPDRTGSASPISERPKSRSPSLSSIGSAGSSDDKVTGHPASPGEIVSEAGDPEPKQRPVSPDRPVEEKDAAGGGLSASLAPYVAGGSGTMSWQEMMSNPMFLNTLLSFMNTAVQAAGRGYVMGPAPTDVVTPMRAATNRGSEQGGGGVDDDAKPGDGGAGRSKRKLGRSPESQEVLDREAKARKSSKKGDGVGQ